MKLLQSAMFVLAMGLAAPALACDCCAKSDSKNAAGECKECSCGMKDKAKTDGKEAKSCGCKKEEKKAS